MLAGFLAISTPASAGLDTYTVGSDGSTVAKDTFSFDETPFLYMNLPEEGFSVTASFWHSPSDLVYFKGDEPDTVIGRWTSLTDTVQWNDVKEVGDWSINTAAFYADGSAFTDTASFTVTPEPLAMTLFLIGGAPIAVSLIRKRKNMVKV